MQTFSTSFRLSGIQKAGTFLLKIIFFATLALTLPNQLVAQWVAWTNTFNGKTNGSDLAKDMIVDGAGNIYVTGESQYLSGSINDKDYITIKYNSSGTQLWRAIYNGPASGDDSPTAITVDNAGNVYVTGTSLNSSGDPDF